MISFIYDGKIAGDGQGNYYSSNLVNSALQRYCYIDPVLNFVVVVNNDIKMQPLISIEHMIVNPIPDMRIPANFISKRRLTSRIMEESIKESDYVMIRIPSFVAGIASRLCIKYRKPYMVEVVGDAFASLWHHSFVGKLIAFPQHIIARNTVRNAWGAVYVTQKYLQLKYPCQRQCTCSDVVLQLWDVSRQEMRIGKIKTRSDKKFVAGTIGNYDVLYKNQELVIKAIAKLKREGIFVRYELVGDGDSHRLRSLAKKSGVENQVIFLGPVNHDLIEDWMMGLDIYIQPSKTEGLGRAILEAMNSGCVCIGTDVGGTMECLEKEWLVSPYSVGDMVELFKNMNEKNMLETSRRNFEYARRFQEEVLETGRNKFYDEYRKNQGL